MVNQPVENMERGGPIAGSTFEGPFEKCLQAAKQTAHSYSRRGNLIVHVHDQVEQVRTFGHQTGLLDHFLPHILRVQHRQNTIHPVLRADLFDATSTLRPGLGRVTAARLHTGVLVIITESVRDQLTYECLKVQRCIRGRAGGWFNQYAKEPTLSTCPKADFKHEAHLVEAPASLQAPGYFFLVENSSMQTMK